VFEKLFPAAQFGADAPVVAVVEIGEGVHWDGKPDHGIPEMVLQRLENLCPLVRKICASPTPP